MRKLLKALLTLLMIIPVSAFALGLGNITLHSALNQPLDAEIQLLSAAPGEVDSLQVGLADTQTFSRLGIDRPGHLMFLRFRVEQKTSGEHIIRVSSTEPIREPFLSFLLDARWAAGRLLREYTLLLDPPLSHAERSPVPTAPVAAAPVAPVRPVEQPATPAPARPSPAAAPGELVYGPVKDNDTLWRIAQEMRPSSDISVQQMMIALLRANPQAFADNNINRLRAGYVLRIDDPALLYALSREEAASEVTRQSNAWQERRQEVADRAPERVAPAAEEVPAPAAVAVAPRTEPELKLVSPDGVSDSLVGTAERAETDTVAAVRQELLLALESSAAQRQENQELLKRIAAMEEQLADMERLLTLKSSDLAVLQQQLSEQESVPATVSRDAEMVAEPHPAPTRPVPAPVQPEPGLLDRLMLDPMLLGAGAALLLLLLAAVVIRRRRTSGFQESILTGGSSSMMAAKASEDKEASFLSDLAISGIGGAGAGGNEEGEVDPLTEADVFLAYGRNQQAEEVLKKAIDDDPKRPELTAKLLEVYYNGRNATAFAALVAGSATALQQREAIWSKVAAMGKELLPDDELFASATESPPPELSRPDSAMPEDVLDIGLDLDELTAEMEGEAELGDDLLDLDLDLTPDDMELGQSATGIGEAETGGSALEEMDFELDLGEDVVEPVQTAGPGVELEQGDLGGQESGFPLEDTLSDTGIEETMPASEEDEGAGSLDLESLDFGDLELGDLEEDALTTLQLGEQGMETVGDVADTDTSDSLPDFAAMDDLDDLGELDEGDEMATKLDLAQAYIEMGDKEGARGMLEEVAGAGSEEQKKQAQDLLSKI